MKYTDSILQQFYMSKLPKAQAGLTQLKSPLPKAQKGWFSSVESDLKNLFGIQDSPEKPKKVVLTIPKSIKIQDKRKNSLVTGKPINPNVELTSGEYPSERIYGIIRAARRYGIDPYTALAIDMQETGLGKRSDAQIGHSTMEEDELIPSKIDYASHIGSMGSTPTDELWTSGFDNFARAIATKMQYADKLGIKDPYERLQAYNGLGKVFPKTEKGYHGYEMQSIYGVPLTNAGIDLRKNPLYGKRVSDIRDNVLMKNEDLAYWMRHIKKQGGPIVDPRGQWAHPGQRTMVPTPTGQITMKGVPYPVYGQDETGYGQMMMPGAEYRFPGQMVYEIPMMRGGGEDDNEEPTLMRSRRVGTIRKPIAKANLRPVYDMKAPVWEDWYVKNCPDGVGCSKQATMSAQKITGLPYSSYAPADAGYRDAVAERYGLTNVFDQEGDQKRNANSRGEGWKYPTSQDFKNWKAGDIVTLDKGDDLYFPYSAPGGFSEKDNSNLTHNGMVYGFDKSGRPIIKHGYQTGKNRGRGITEVLGDDGRVSSLGHGKYAIKSVWRPKEVNDDNTINTVVDVVDDAQARATRKKNTTSNQSFYVKNDFTDTNSPADYFSGAVNRSETKQRLVDMFNNEKLDKELQYKLGMTADEVDNIKPVIYGVFGQETNFNDVNSIGAAPKEILGSILGVGSRGPAQIKLDSLSKDERKILGIKRASDLEKDDVSYKAAMLLLNNARKRMNMEVEQGTHPELQNADEYFRAGYYYNSPARSVSSAKEWGKKSKPVTLNPLTWFNKLSTRERPGVFAGVNPNYAEQEELRMDKGSYPYKLMEKARDLGVDVDFDNASDLEEIVIRGAKKGTNYKKMTNGGLLSRSVSCSNCGHSWQAIDGGLDPLSCHKCGGMVKMQVGGQRAPIYTENLRDPRLRSYNDSLSMYKSTLNLDRMMYNNPIMAASNIEKIPTNPNVVYKDPVLSWHKGEAYLDGKTKNYKEIEKQSNKPVGYKSIQDASQFKKVSYPVYKKPVQPVVYRKPELSTLYVDDLNNPRLKAYRDSLSLSSRPRRNPNPMISVSNFDKLHYAGASKAYAEKNIMPVGFRDFSTEPYRASEPVFAKPKQRVEYRKPQPAVAQQQPQILPAQQPTTPAYRMQGSTPVYGPSNSLIGMMNQESGAFYPDYMNTAGRARVNQADADMIGNQQKILEYLRMKGVNNAQVIPQKKNGGQHGGLDRWFAEKWVDVKTGKDCGRQEGESRKGYPACRPSKRVSSQTPKTSSEMSAAEKAKFKRSKTSSERINYNHKRN